MIPLSSRPHRQVGAHHDVHIVRENSWVRPNHGTGAFRLDHNLTKRSALLQAKQAESCVSCQNQRAGPTKIPVRAPCPSKRHIH